MVPTHSNVDEVQHTYTVGKQNITHPMCLVASHRPVDSEGETPGWQTLASSEHVPAALVTASLHIACMGRRKKRKEEGGREGGRRKEVKRRKKRIILEG